MTVQALFSRWYNLCDEVSVYNRTYLHYLSHSLLIVLFVYVLPLEIESRYNHAVYIKHYLCTLNITFVH